MLQCVLSDLHHATYISTLPPSCAVNTTPKEKKLVPQIHAELLKQVLLRILKDQGISDITQVSGRTLKVVLTVPAHFKHVSFVYLVKWPQLLLLLRSLIHTLADIRPVIVYLSLRV